MISIKRQLRRGISLVTALAFVAASTAPFLVSGTTYAGQFSSRKLTQSSQAAGTVSTDTNGTAVPAGNGGNGAQTRHTFNFTIASSANVGSMVFQYCTTPLFNTACTAPTGMDASTVATIQSQTGFSSNNFTLDTSTVANTGGIFATAPCSGASPYRTNCILIKRASAAAETPTAVTVAFGNTGSDWIKNPTTTGAFYVRITSFTDTGYSTVNDQAAVAGSVNTAIDITAKVQELLNFSVAVAYSAPSTNCAALSGTGSTTLGDPTNGVLSFSQAYDQHTYFRLSTNAQNGTSVLYSGDTLKTAGGGSSITAAGATFTTSAVGTSQFGIGLDSSDSNQSLTNLTAATNYAAGNGTITNAGTAKFAYDPTSVSTPVQLASAASGTTVTCDTGSVRYLGNISTTTKAGIYKTNINYIAVPTF